MGFEKEFPWKTDEEMLRHFYEPLKEAQGVSYELLEANPQGIFLPKPMKLYEKDGFATPSKKIELHSSIMEKMGYDPLPKYIEPAKSPVSTPELAEEYPLILITGARILEYCHSTMRHIPELRELVPEPTAEIDPGTAAKHGIANGEMIMVETPAGSVKYKARVTEDIHPGVVSISHGWHGKSNVNRLISDEDRDPIAGYPQDKAVLCRIRKISGNERVKKSVA
jgi:anaerobic selenocysteine-containing dehydrogenase